MALSDDQKAMLRLLAQREEGYGDIAALLGLSVDEVRGRVRAALAELDSPAAAPARPIPSPPPPSPGPDPASAPSEQAPPARQPRSDRPRPEPAAPARPRRAARPRPTLPKSRRRLFEIIGGAVVALLLVLFVTGAVDLDGDGDDSNQGADATQARNGGDSSVTEAVLTPPEGGEASGRAVFGRVGKGPVLQVAAEGLGPTARGQSYTVWLYRNPKLVLRLGAVKVGEEGGIAAQLPVPVELLSYVAGGAFNQVHVSLTRDADYKKEIAAARRQKRLPAYSGTTVLSGKIAGPLVQS